MGLAKLLSTTFRRAKRPVWLFSLDTEKFSQPPMTTGALKAYFHRNGATRATTDIELVHFLQREEIESWYERQWKGVALAAARRSAAGETAPVAGFSFYTWNTSEFLELIALLRRDCPQLVIIGGGPQVQQAEDYLKDRLLDVVVLGEGEITFTEWLDRPSPAQWGEVPGLAFMRDGAMVKTPARARTQELDQFPSALEVVPLRDEGGRPRYRHCAYETTRGCPFRCAFCEWGTGAIGTKMFQFTLDRIRNDWQRLLAGGIEDLWLSDSNFGALPEDLAKAELVVKLKAETGYPRTFQTSWSKNHTSRVQEIVLLLQRAGLLQHYNLALQTLTPLALDLSRRRNMRNNRYEPIAKKMAAAGVQIATELIWGLPGDNVADFGRNLDRLSTVFPNINVFGYTLLPGTEFYARREEYKIETIPVAGYGRSKGEYVIACHTFSREEGFEGYFLITAHIMLVRGFVMPLTARYLALSRQGSTTELLRAVLEALLGLVAEDLPGVDLGDRMTVYENRSRIYVATLRRRAAAFGMIRRTISSWLEARGAANTVVRQALQALDIDELLCPQVGARCTVVRDFPFSADEVERALSRMELPPASAFDEGTCRLSAVHPGGVGEVLTDPDGGSWMRGVISAGAAPLAAGGSG